jgi:hypothetical protein
MTTMQEDYAAERARKIATLRALTAAIAKALGEGFQAKEDKELEHVGEIRHADGRCINLNSSWYERQRRLNVSGDYPRDEGNNGSYSDPKSWGAIAYNESPPSITVSADRSPEAIARDIQRRFLPEYTRIYNLCIEKRNERNAARSGYLSKAETILKALGKRRAEIVGAPDNTHVDLRYSDSGYGKLTETSIDLHSLSFETVLEIAAVLAKKGR